MLGGGSSGIQTSNSPGNTTLRTERRISASTLRRCLGLGLDPLKNEISCQIRTGQDGRKLVVIVQRDGYLTIAHKSGYFGGMESGTKEDDKGRIIGWARVWNKAFPEH